MDDNELSKSTGFTDGPDSLADDADAWVVEAFIRHRDEIIQTGDTLEEYGPVFLRIAQEEGHDLPILRSLLEAGSSAAFQPVEIEITDEMITNFLSADLALRNRGGRVPLGDEALPIPVTAGSGLSGRVLLLRPTLVPDEKIVLRVMARDGADESALTSVTVEVVRVSDNISEVVSFAPFDGVTGSAVVSIKLDGGIPTGRYYLRFREAG